jgi:hypothetical protein
MSRRSRFHPLLIVVAALVTAAPVVAATRTVGILDRPRNLAAGALQQLSVGVAGSPTCSLSVRYADGAMQVVGTRAVTAWRVEWTWRVPRAAAAGPALATVTCGAAGRLRASFRVAARAAAARVTVVKTGFTQTTNGDVSYGIVLANPSRDEDALNVVVGINLLDGAGRVIRSDASSIVAVPAGTTFFLGGVMTPHDGARVARLQPIVDVSGSRPRSVLEPTATDVRVDASDVGTRVDGEVVNGPGGILSRTAKITAVFFDRGGNVIGGASTLPPFELPPGASAAFEMTTSMLPSAIASVQTSVEPRYSASG